MKVDPLNFFCGFLADVAQLVSRDLGPKNCVVFKVILVFFASQECVLETRHA